MAWIDAALTLTLLLLAAPGARSRCEGLRPFETQLCLSARGRTAALAQWTGRALADLAPEVRAEFLDAAKSAGAGRPRAALDLVEACDVYEGFEGVGEACSSLLPQLLEAIPVDSRNDGGPRALLSEVKAFCHHERFNNPERKRAGTRCEERLAGPLAWAAPPPAPSAAPAVTKGAPLPSSAAAASGAPEAERAPASTPAPAPEPAARQAPAPSRFKLSFSLPVTLGDALTFTGSGATRNSWAFGLRPTVVASPSLSLGVGGYGECLWAPPFSDARCGGGALLRLGRLGTVSPSLGAFARKVDSGAWEPGVSAGIFVGYRMPAGLWEGPAGFRLEVASGLGASRLTTVLLALEIDPGYLLYLAALIGFSRGMHE